MQEAILSTA